ncbi:MAG: metal ABC transporter substrate-binding protein [Planctomycetota bacterium]
MRWLYSLFPVIFMTLCGCERSGSDLPVAFSVEEVVRATAAPVGSMARDIAGDLIRVEMLCPDGQDPASWRPEPDVIAAYQRARLIIANGADLEIWARTAPLPRSRVVWTADAIGEEFLVVRGETHSHGPGGEHAHDRIVGHTWIDPINAIAQARAIGEAMSLAFPEHASAFQENTQRLTARLQEAHDRLLGLDTSGVRLIAAADPFGYLTRRYSWETADLGAPPGDRAAASDDTDGHALSTGTSTPIVMITDAAPNSDAGASIGLEEPRVFGWETGGAASGADYAATLLNNIDRLATMLEAIRDEAGSGDPDTQVEQP